MSSGTGWQQIAFGISDRERDIALGEVAESALREPVPGELELFSIFQPYAYKRFIDSQRRNQRFVHYTTADTAIKILKSHQVWMRNCACMNDYSEAKHGFSCLQSALNKHRKTLSDIIDPVFPGLAHEVEVRFDADCEMLQRHTYITCLSEHDGATDRYGKLSMWRAYGGSAGAALVFNGGVFLRPSDALGVYTSPVAYLDDATFDAEFCKVLESISAKYHRWSTCERPDIFRRLYIALIYAALCTKHPGFEEEREWRVIYTPSIVSSSAIKFSVQSVRGVPQPVCLIPLRDNAAEGLFGLEVSSLINRIIVGPSANQEIIKEAFRLAVCEEVDDTAQRDRLLGQIYLSGTPLRS